MAKTIYRCRFYFRNNIEPFDAFSEEGIIAFKNGFWVDSDLSYTKLNGARYWIPPHKIEYIAKEQTE